MKRACCKTNCSRLFAVKSLFASLPKMHVIAKPVRRLVVAIRSPNEKALLL